MDVFLKNILPEARLAQELKRKCAEYVDEYLNEDFMESEFGRELVRNAPDDETGNNVLIDGEKWIRQLDNYIMFGNIKSGPKVLKEIKMKAGLNEEGKEILEQWSRQAFSSIFAIKEVDEYIVRVMDLLAEVDYCIYLKDMDMRQMFIRVMSAGSFLQTSIMPVKNIWFFSGLQSIFKKDAEPSIFHDYIVKASSRQIFRNNPKKLQKALEIQKKHYEVFVDMFGTDELVVPVDQVQEKLQEYYDRLSSGKRNSDKITVPEAPLHFRSAETIGVVMDEREGIYEFGNYGEFVEIFTTSNVSKKSRELIMYYLEDDSIPAFVFHRMSERYPGMFYNVMSLAVTESGKRIFQVDDFDQLMDKFKPGWRETYPSVAPMNQYFSKYYHNDLGRNDPCHCGSGKKFKKCHGNTGS